MRESSTVSKGGAAESWHAAWSRVENWKNVWQSSLFGSSDGDPSAHHTPDSSRPGEGKTLMFAGDDAESPFMKDALKALRRGVTS
eukprot:CAMPEP_0180272036 /NCGR_PEP_ID=MMETSP0988-20121125/4033_1 /TAXON_ID=697907 /ORGANISM="non described non described, Strain CCMP2293" /LENGTH=84 /DNA_ID=CAMNT_0022243085 /DNA_START=103 /DNA_END=354 /DNA_ORIENTATION=-